MAADLIMPTLPGDQHSRHFFPQQRPTHQRNQSYQISVGPQISPINTNESTSPDSISSTPTSPRAHHARQTRPMYMPAALRPNLFPSKTNKMPIDDAASTSSTEPDSALRRTNSSLINLPGMSVFGNKLARVSTGDSAQSSIDGDFDPEMFPEVKAQPTRKHWKVSKAKTSCRSISLAQHLLACAIVSDIFNAPSRTTLDPVMSHLTSCQHISRSFYPTVN
jgi:hypothetical protein